MDTTSVATADKNENDRLGSDQLEAYRESITKLLNSHENKSKRWMFPNDEDYELLVQILSSQRGAKIDSVSSSTKTGIMKNFKIDKKGEYVIVVSKEDGKELLKQSSFVDVFLGKHRKGGTHFGQLTTYKAILQSYVYVPQQLVRECVKLCSICAEHQPFRSTIAGQAIKSKSTKYFFDSVMDKFNVTFLGPMGRLNVDCIDMRSTPDGEFKWIVHAVDHLSKFHFAKALRSKVIKKLIFLIIWVGSPQGNFGIGIGKD